MSQNFLNEMKNEILLIGTKIAREKLQPLPGVFSTDIKTRQGWE